MERNCDNCKYRDVYYIAPPCGECNFEYQRQPQKGFQNLESDAMTNADRIRSMSDEELAEFLEAIISQRQQTILENLNGVGIDDVKLVEFPTAAKQFWLEWLKEEVKRET